jgi:hypothetical protein
MIGFMQQAKGSNLLKIRRAIANDPAINRSRPVQIVA